MRIGVPAEQLPGEHRVALVPASIASLKKAGFDVEIERGAGERAGFTDSMYQEKGAQIVASRAEVFDADVVLQVRAGSFESMRQGQVVIAMVDPLGSPETVREIASRGVTAFALELIPRITRAQSMDVLSSMATIAGYKAVLLAAGTLPRMFPLLTTAAGTVTPAHVFIVGVGVAGLQAIATARKLGAVVEAYDVRPAVKEQVQSVGAKFVELPLETAQSEDKGGYAKAQDEAFYQRQREMMARVVAGNDVVITTAVVPGKKAPVLVTAEMVRGMAPGSVVVDLAAERGGNCELTRADQVVVEQGVTILGPTNLPSTVPYHASQMYAKNVTTFLLHLVKDGVVTVDPTDEITRDTLITRDGEVVNARVRQALGMPELVGSR
ncbi:MAG: Re/Si-specific NAD(P)(+) transhydrogenase subunit alpha [Vicinamibacterales bacterium]